MNIAQKSFSPVEFKLSEQGEVVVAFSRLDTIDKDNDVTRPGALPTGKTVPMSAYGHTSWDGALPTGKGTITERDGLGIFEGHFFLKTDHGRNAYETVLAMGDAQEWSYGYVILDGGPGTFGGKNVRELRKLDVFEVSPVLVGAGAQTHTLAIKSDAPGPESSYAEHASWVQEQVKAFVDRTSDRAEWRAKEGRTLSQSNRAVLASILDALETFGPAAAELRRLLADTDPAKTEADDAAKRSLMVEIERARALGIPI